MEFWRHLHEASVSDDGRFLTLAEGTFFLGNALLGRSLFIRDCCEYNNL